MARPLFLRFDLNATRAFPKPRPFPIGPDGWVALSLRLATPDAAAPAARAASAEDLVVEVQAQGGSPRAHALADRLEALAQSLRREGGVVQHELALGDLLPASEG